MKRRIWPVLLASVLLLCGCTRPGMLIKPTSPEEDSTETEVPYPEDPLSSEESEAEDDGSPVIPSEDPGAKFYLILPTAGGPSAREEELIRKAADEAGIEIIVKYYEHDANAQTEAFNEAVDIGASLIVCDNADNEQTERSCRAAKDAGVPVFLLNRGIDMMGVAGLQILTDSYSCVRELGERFVEQVAEHSKYIEVLGLTGSYDISEAFSMSVAGYPGMEMVASDMADENDASASYDLCWNLISAHPEADAIVCYNALQASEAADAAADLGREMTVLCLFGDNDEIVDLVQANRVFATVVKPAAEIAELASERILSYLTTGIMPADEVVFVRGEVITSGIAPRIWDPSWEDADSVTEGAEDPDALGGAEDLFDPETGEAPEIQTEEEAPEEGPGGEG